MDQAINAHSTRAPAQGLVYRTIRLSKGDDRAFLGLWRGEAEETGHSEESGVWGEAEWNEWGGGGGG